MVALTDLMVQHPVMKCCGIVCVRGRAQPPKPSGNPTAHCMLAAGAAGWLDTAATALPAILAQVVPVAGAAAITATQREPTARPVQVAEAEAAAVVKIHLTHAPHSRAVLVVAVPC